MAGEVPTEEAGVGRAAVDIRRGRARWPRVSRKRRSCERRRIAHEPPRAVAMVAVVEVEMEAVAAVVAAVVVEGEEEEASTPPNRSS